MKLLLLTTLFSLFNRVPTANQFFAHEWNEDNRRITLIRDYMRQTEKDFGAFDCQCQQFGHIGKAIPTPETLRPIIEQALGIHHSHANVCFFKRLNEGIHSDLSGNIFIDAKDAGKLTPDQFLAVLGHELGHRYAFRFLADLSGPQEELFSDVISAWTMKEAGKNPMMIISAIWILDPKGKGDAAHPSNKARDQSLAAIVSPWELPLLAGH